MALRKNLKITLDIKKIALFILGISAFILAYFTMQFTLSPERLRYAAPPPPPMPHTESTIVDMTQPILDIAMPSALPALDDPYVPPLVYPETQMISPEYLADNYIAGGLREVPSWNRRFLTTGMPAEYRQLGFLTRSSGTKTGDKMILPLMGRSLRNGRDKWQYYTLSNSPGTVQTRLPISVNGRSCTSEYGCDSISDGDVVYVDGYEETFRATLYETGLFSYLVA